MEQLKFTTRVLGPAAAYRLEQYQVTQTLRSHNDSIVQAILLDRIQNRQMQVILDNRMIGLAQYDSISLMCLGQLTISDAQRGGFDSISDLTLALKRAGYRFMPIDMYRLYRLQFTWLEVEGDKALLVQST